MPIMMFVGNLNYVVIAVLGGLRVASGTMSLGEVQAFIQYSRQFTQPLTQVASMVNLLQSGVASAERVFELLDAEEQEPDGRRRAGQPSAHGEVRFEDVSFSYDPERPLIEDLSLVAHPGQTVAIVGPTGAGKTTLVNLVERFYEVSRRPDHPRRRRHHLDAARRPARADRHGAAGHLAVRGDHPRQHRLRPPGRDRGGDPRGPREATFVDRFVHSLPDGYDTAHRRGRAPTSPPASGSW